MKAKKPKSKIHIPRDGMPTQEVLTTTPNNEFSLLPADLNGVTTVEVKFNADLPKWTQNVPLNELCIALGQPSKKARNKAWKKLKKQYKSR